MHTESNYAIMSAYTIPLTGKYNRICHANSMKIKYTQFARIFVSFLGNWISILLYFFYTYMKHAKIVDTNCKIKLMIPNHRKIKCKLFTINVDCMFDLTLFYFTLLFFTWLVC